jgi:FixJ family two-component response regulator
MGLPPQSGWIRPSFCPPYWTFVQLMAHPCTRNTCRMDGRDLSYTDGNAESWRPTMDTDAGGAMVHVINSDAGARSALQRTLAGAGYRVITYAAAGDYLVPAPHGEPGCLLLDVQFPGASGLDLQSALQRYPAYRRPIVFLGGSADVPASVRAMREGAREFLTKPVARDVLLAAVEDAIAYDLKERAQQREAESARERLAALRWRERQVLEGIAQGRGHKQLAVELGVSERTIKADRARVMRQLGVTTLAGLFKALKAARDPAARQA